MTSCCRDSLAARGIFVVLLIAASCSNNGRNEFYVTKRGGIDNDEKINEAPCLRYRSFTFGMPFLISFSTRFSCMFFTSHPRTSNIFPKLLSYVYYVASFFTLSEYGSFNHKRKAGLSLVSLPPSPPVFLLPSLPPPSPHNFSS
jgi:hypothetical protein